MTNIFLLFCDTIAWVLLRNHFHLLVYVRSAEQVETKKLFYTATEHPKKIDVHLQFGHFFNSHAKAINKKFKRSGSLFEKRFERKEVVHPAYLRQLILYIHYNPVRHGFCETIQEYPWSSYGSIISHQPTKLKRDFVLTLFNCREEFQLFHKEVPDMGLEGNVFD